MDVQNGFKQPNPDYSIGSFQLLPKDKKRLKAISKWPRQEEAWLQVAEAIREFCENE